MPIALALDTAIAFLKRWKLAFLVLPIILFAGVQTARIEGFLWIDGYKEKLAQRDKTIADLKEASAKNLAAQIEQKRQWEQTSTKLAKDRDNAYQAGREEGDALASAYIARNRVRKGSGGSSTPAAPGERADPGVPEEVPADAVMVSADDVRQCTAAVNYAVQAHMYAMEKIGAGLAE